MTELDLQETLPTIGWRETVSLPDWGIQGIRAKIDTGARTSAIHVANIEHLPSGNIRFEVVIHERPVRETIWVETEPSRESLVKPSSGIRQRRIVCKTKLRIGEHEFETDVSLVCRKGMLCRMLVGRTAIAGHFVVDPSAKYAQTEKQKNKRKKKSKAKI